MNNRFLINKRTNDESLKPFIRKASLPSHNRVKTALGQIDKRSFNQYSATLYRNEDYGYK